MTTRHLFGIFLVLCGGYAFGAGSGGGGGGGFSGTSTAAPAKLKSPEEVSAQHYQAGVHHKERAWKQERKAVDATNDKRRDRALAKAQKEYKKAIDRQGKAIEAKTSNYAAANELGYALRKTGDFETALQAYELALAVQPAYYPAIEYRGEAFLALSRFDDAKNAYMVLFNNEPELANQLMGAMTQWADNSAEAQLTEQAVAFKNWVAERRTLAQLTQALTPSAGRSW
jgi:tetratricopeptide (TPR) repeat protein